MNAIYVLTKRHLLSFFRDRRAVFFSFMSIFIIIGLYALFLGKVLVDGIKADVGDVSGVRYLVDSWIMAGTLTVNAVTVSLGAFGIMVEDGTRGTSKEFLVSPIRKSHLLLSYLLAVLIIGLVVSFFGFIMAEIYIIAAGGEFLGLVNSLKVLGVLSVVVLSSAALISFLVTFVSTTQAHSTLSALIGTLIGFLAGIYIPIGIMPEMIQSVIKLIPFTYGAALLRQVFMEEPLQEVFAGAPEAMSSYNETFGVVVKVGNHEVSQGLMVIILLLSAIVFFGLAVMRLIQKQART